ncbi:MAG: glutamine-hydrolyzing GMP synthase [Dehalococcoidia bacterium]|nr:glutamine-hydrolyzing GMP synthase [Dehalococcoidia bacterium]
MHEQAGSAETTRITVSGDAEVSAYLEIAEEKVGAAPVSAVATAPPARETVVVLDFGSQYSLLIARRVRELKVYCEIVPHDVSRERIEALNPRGFILSGGPASVYEQGAPIAPAFVFQQGVPVLGICYGMQLLVHQLGGKVAPGERREYGHAVLRGGAEQAPILRNIPPNSQVWMSHGDRIETLPPGFRSLASTDNSPIAIMGNDRGMVGLQFHPEVAHTVYGKELLRNFLYDLCGCTGTWTAGNFIVEGTERIRQQVGAGRVICALSGGVDSAVAAMLIHQAVGDQLTCIFVNNGLLRREEAERTLDTFHRNLMWNIRYVDASDRFLTALNDVTDPETKRKAVGETFIRVFEEEAKKLGRIDFLAQGTLYPDVIESTTGEHKITAKIKTHHNVGGLPTNMQFSLIEPLRFLFKDEARQVGLALGLPEEMVWRQPFPGPGLAIRMIGSVTRERLEMLRSCDWIVMDEIKKANYYREVAQVFAVLPGVRTVGVMGDFRTYGEVAALRAITTDDFMTADWARLPYDLLARISNRIVNEVPGVNRVVYDISSKPPSTVEWE